VTDANVRGWLGDHGVEPRAIDVVHDRPWSTVLRVATADGDLYLKQCAPVQAFEVPLTMTLAARWADRVPEIVAADAGRAWLLMHDGGAPLSESETIDPLVSALRLYGELQLAETVHVDEFLAIGLPDVRLPVIAPAYEPFLERDHGLEPDEAARLRALAPRYRALCSELEKFGFPASIQHDDLREGNVYVLDGRVRIFDWGDSSVAHPLFSWLKPLDAALDRSLDPEPFLGAYLSAWSAFAPERELRGALALAVPIGSFAYAFQYQRQLDAMAPDVRPGYAAYMTELLRELLERLDGLA
jgi:hypothetical protein